MASKPENHVIVYLDAKAQRRLSRLAKRAGLSRSALVRQLLEQADPAGSG